MFLKPAFTPKDIGPSVESGAPLKASFIKIILFYDLWCLSLALDLE